MKEGEVDTEAKIPSTNGEARLTVSITGGVRAAPPPGANKENGEDAPDLFKAALSEIQDCKICPTAPKVRATRAYPSLVAPTGQLPAGNIDRTLLSQGGVLGLTPVVPPALDRLGFGCLPACSARSPFFPGGSQVCCFLQDSKAGVPGELRRNRVSLLLLICIVPKRGEGR